jgi:hypothetical protein
LRERVTVSTVLNPPHDVFEIRAKQTTNAGCFEIISVAALRSAGIPARLGSDGRAEIVKASP